MRTTPTHRRTAVLALAMVATLGVGACSGQGSTSSGAAPQPVVAPADGAKAAPEAQSAGAAPAAPGSAGAVAGAGSAASAVTEVKIARSAAMFVRVKEVGPSAAAIRGVVIGFGGQVASESVNATPDVPPSGVPSTRGAAPTSSIPPLGNYGQLTLSVPADKLDQAIDEIGKLGTVIQRSSTSQDVTAQSIDLETRLKNKQASVERVRALMAQATDLKQIVELESQLSSREAELESLKAQSAALAKRVAMSTLVVTVTANAQVAPKEEPPTGFLGGLYAGWKALATSATVLLTFLGALLPWAVVLGLPLWLLYRAWTRRRAAQRAQRGPARYAEVRPATRPEPEPEAETAPETAPDGDPDGEPDGKPEGKPDGEVPARTAPTTTPPQPASGPTRTGD